MHVIFEIIEMYLLKVFLRFARKSFRGEALNKSRQYLLFFLSKRAASLSVSEMNYLDAFMFGSDCIRTDLLASLNTDELNSI